MGDAENIATVLIILGLIALVLAIVIITPIALWWALEVLHLVIIPLTWQVWLAYLIIIMIFASAKGVSNERC